MQAIFLEAVVAFGKSLVGKTKLFLESRLGCHCYRF